MGHLHPVKKYYVISGIIFPIDNYIFVELSINVNNSLKITLI